MARQRDYAAEYRARTERAQREAGMSYGKLRAALSDARARGVSDSGAVAKALRNITGAGVRGDPRRALGAANARAIRKLGKDGLSIRQIFAIIYPRKKGK